MESPRAMQTLSLAHIFVALAIIVFGWNNGVQDLTFKER